MSDFENLMNTLSPVAWWRLGDSGPDVVEEVSGLDGTYENSPSLGQSGAIAGDTDDSVLFNATQSEYVEVDDHSAFSLVRAHDGFTLVLNGWGTADSGGSWTTQVSSPSYFSCDGFHAVINQTTTEGTWQQGIGVSRRNCEIQVRVRWSIRASGGTLKPLMLVARRQDADNYYRAQLQEDADHNLQLLLVKVINGTPTVLATDTIGTYTVNEWWYLRFRLDGSEYNLKARAWKDGNTQPVGWLSASDSSITDAGTIAIRSSNSGTSSRPIVQFDRFWVQTLGMTVHLWMRPWGLTFDGEDEGDYIHFLGKGTSGQQEWVFRFYNQQDANRENRVSAYMFNLSGGLGVGAYWQPDAYDPIADLTWYQFVAVFDPGDELDQTAGVSLFKNGAFVKGPRDGYSGSGSSPGTFYRWSTAPVTPGNGTAPLRFATRDLNSFFSGRLDEIAIFDRALTDDEIEDLYDAAT